MKIYFSNDGCEVGKLYSSYVQELFLKNEPKIINTTDPKEADIIIFYACGLTARKEEQSLLTVEAIKSIMKPSARLIVWGCLSKQNPTSLKNQYSGPIVGPTDLHVFEEILKQTTNEPKCLNLTQIPNANILLREETVESMPTAKQGTLYRVFNNVDKYLSSLLFKSNPLTFYIRAAEGCNSHCTYCSEHLVWGQIRSKPLDKIISEFEDGLRKGYTQFFLCAEDLGPYGIDIGLKVTDLLKQLVTLDADKPYKIIINELSPTYLRDMLPDFEKVFATGRISTLGVQVESGSDRILKLMGRQYKADEWRALMLHINRNFPSIDLSTHFMVGFPTETDEDFNATMRLLDFPLLLNDILIFKYSARPNIPAARLSGQIPQSTIEYRARKLQRKFWYTHPLNYVIRYPYSLLKRTTYQFDLLKQSMSLNNIDSKITKTYHN